MPRRSALLILTALVALPASAAHARTRDLWATVNVCDTPRHPNRLGVRARMPGDGTRHRMYMRFTAQFRSGSSWKAIRGGRSSWLYVGSALFRWKEAGFTFRLSAPRRGASYLTRGVVEFQWRRRNGRVVHRGRRLTEAGHPGTRNADPRRYSAATCRIRTPG
jgi:hypothetical protein